MSKEIFDFSEALRRMKEGKKVRRKIFADGTYAYIDKNYIGSEALMYNSVGRAAPVLWLLPETIFATDWEEVEGWKKKILTLTIDKQWFDMVVSGKKKEEYRVIKGYWAKRLLLVRSELEEPFSKLDKDLSEKWDSISPEMAKHCFNSPYYKTVPFTHVLFINGYRKDSPRIEKEIESISIGKPKKGLCPDKWLDTEFFIIKFK